MSGNSVFEEKLKLAREEARRKAIVDMGKTIRESHKPIIRNIESSEEIKIVEDIQVATYIRIKDNILPCPKLNLVAPMERDETIKTSVKCDMGTCVSCKECKGLFVSCGYGRKSEF